MIGLQTLGPSINLLPNLHCSPVRRQQSTGLKNHQVKEMNATQHSHQAASIQLAEAMASSQFTYIYFADQLRFEQIKNMQLRPHFLMNQLDQVDVFHVHDAKNGFIKQPNHNPERPIVFPPYGLSAYPAYCCFFGRIQQFLFDINIQFEMNFNLENPSFSQSSDEEDLLVPSNEMIKEYNREYSMIVGEIERFLKQVKESVQRFVAFHNFGISLNLPTLLQNILTTDQTFKNRLAQAETTSNADPKQGAKLRYEVSFNRLIHKMGELLKEFIDCELQFKRQYFGFKDQKQERMRNAERVRTLSPQNYSISVSSITNSSKSSKMQIQQIMESQQKEEKRQAELRVMLNERLQPKAPTIEIECKTEYSTTENLYRLNEKIDRMFEEMKTVKNREEKLIELFNLNRVKKIHTPSYEDLPPFPSTDVSVIEASTEQDEVDSFLEGCRPLMKDMDTITEQGYHPKNRSFAKRPPSLLLAQFIE